MGSTVYKKGDKEYPAYLKRQRERMRARRALEKEGKVKKGDGKEVDHKKPLKAGGSNSKSNLQVVDQKTNRAWRKGKKGYSTT